MRKQEPRSIGSLIKESLEQLPQLQLPLQTTRVIEAWPEVVGKGVAAYTRSIALRNGVLYVSLSSPIVRNELYYIRDRIIARLNERAEAPVVRQIVFK